MIFVTTNTTILVSTGVIMSVSGLSGSNSKTIFFKQIKAVYDENLYVAEEAIKWLKPFKNYTTPNQVYETFSKMMNETKEMFITLHLDLKNRIVCADIVSIGSLNQGLVYNLTYFICQASSTPYTVSVEYHPQHHKQLCNALYHIAGSRIL